MDRFGPSLIGLAAPRGGEPANAALFGVCLRKSHVASLYKTRLEGHG